RAARHPCMVLREQLLRVLDALALQHLGHQRGSRGRDRAAAPLKADIGDPVALDSEVHGDPVAAERVVAARQMRRMLQGMEIARMPAVIEDDVLIQLAKLVAHRNISRQASTASASRSISLSSL